MSDVVDFMLSVWKNCPLELGPMFSEYIHDKTLLALAAGKLVTCEFVVVPDGRAADVRKECLKAEQRIRDTLEAADKIVIDDWHQEYLDHMHNGCLRDSLMMVEVLQRVGVVRPTVEDYFGLGYEILRNTYTEPDTGYKYTQLIWYEDDDLGRRFRYMEDPSGVIVPLGEVDHVQPDDNICEHGRGRGRSADDVMSDWELE